MFVRFRMSYYQTSLSTHKTSLSVFWSVGYTLVVVDCTRQNVHQERHHGYAIRMWIQRECTCEYYRLLTHLMIAWSNITHCPTQCARSHKLWYLQIPLPFQNKRYKNWYIFGIRRSLEKLFVITPIFVDLQGFFVERRFVMKEVAVLRKETVLTHYIFVNLSHKSYWQDPRSLTLFSWLLITMNCNGKIGWSRLAQQNVITIIIIGTDFKYLTADWEVAKVLYTTIPVLCGLREGLR